VLFYPDGRCTSALLILTGDDGYQADVQLRGLTGTVRIGPLRRTEVLSWEQQEIPSPDTLEQPATAPPAASDAMPSR
jgi:hypothetical protein